MLAFDNFIDTITYKFCKSKFYRLVICLSIAYRSTFFISFKNENICTFNSKTENKNTSNSTYDGKDMDKINSILAKSKILQSKVSLGSISKKEKRVFKTSINKLFKLKNFNYELCEELLSQIR